MENLGESLKYLKSEMATNWEQEDMPMETDEDRQHQQLQQSLLEEVSLSFPHMGTTVNPNVAAPIPMPVPIVLPILNEASSSNLPEHAGP